GATADTRGLARAALALDAASIRAAVERAMAEHAVALTWTEMLLSVLVAIGERWAATGEGVEVEHLLAETAGSALRAGSTAPEPRNGRPGLLACAPEGQQRPAGVAGLGAGEAPQPAAVGAGGGAGRAGHRRAAARRRAPAGGAAGGG